jgi:hypothetical protein
MHHRDRRAQELQFIKHPFVADVTEMPNLVRAIRQIRNNRRQLVMGVSKDENAERFRRGVGVPEWWSNGTNLPHHSITPLLHSSRCASGRAV